MNETIGQGGAMAALPPRGIGEILSTAFQLYRRYWRTLVAIAAVVVVPLTLVQYGIGRWVRSHGEQLRDQVVVSTSFWAVASASLLAALVGLLLYQVLTGAITRNIAAEVAGQDLGLEQSYRFGFARLGPILVVSILVGLATLLGLILFIIPGIYIGVRLAVSIQALVVEGRRGTEAMRRSWELVGGHWWHTAFTLLVAGLITGVVNAVITAPFGSGAWFLQGVAAAVATTVTLPYGALVGVLLYLDLRARKEPLDLDTLKANLQATAA
jgi:membrane-anchored glycerophosphoryl diester phosphodiesterase (GDPDase)